MMTMAEFAVPEGAGRALWIGRLTLTDLRNYVAARVEVDGRPVILTGPNGAGKTNLLEAVSLLAPGRGLRGAPFDQIARQAGPGAAPQWAVAARLCGPDGEVDVGTAWQAAADDATGGQNSRQVKIDGETQRSSGMLGARVRIVWLTPAMDRLFAGPAGDRRRFLDRLVLAFDPDHGPRVNRLDKLLRERNRLLDEARYDGRWLDSIEDQLAEAGAAVAVARVDAIEALQTYIDGSGETPGGPACFPRAELAIDGELEAKVRDMPAVQLEDEYRRLLSDSRRRDQAAGRTLNGPHRADLMVSHHDKAMPARSCSTGEQKALLISMTLAHTRAVRSRFSGWTPLVLLDEIAAHLDAERRAALFGEIEALGCQAWMTGTDDGLFEALAGRANVLHVQDGTITGTT